MSKNALYLCIVGCVLTAIQVLIYNSTQNQKEVPTLLFTKFKYIDKTKRLDKKLFVMGILTKSDFKDRRQILRNTFIKNIRMHEHLLPYRFEYKFCLDQETNLTKSENETYNDIMYLNCTRGCGYAANYGFKLQAWIKYVMVFYPDVSLMGRMDDDVFVCVPQIFYYLKKIESPLLYFGWNQTKTAFFDEQFFVLGRQHLERLWKRKYCMGQNCNPKEHLVERTYGTNSFQTWIQIYNDVDIRPDNTRIVHFLWAFFPKEFRAKSLHRFVQPDFCDYQLTFHKADKSTMLKMHEFNTMGVLNRNNTPIIQNWTGNYVRTDPYKLEFYNRITTLKNHTKCNTWIVLSTLNLCEELITLLLDACPACCMVVLESFSSVYQRVSTEKLYSLEQKQKWNASNVFLLTIDEQEHFYPLLSDFIPRTSAIGRRNIGYAYAIQNGANTIIDIVIQINESNAPKNKINDSSNNNINSTFKWHCLKNQTFNFSISKIVANSSHLFTNRNNLLYSISNVIWCSSFFEWLIAPTSISERFSFIWRNIIADNVKRNLSLDGLKLHQQEALHYHPSISDEDEFNDSSFLKLNMLAKYLKDMNRIPSLEQLYMDLYMRKYIDIQDFYLASAWKYTLKNLNFFKN